MLYYLAEYLSDWDVTAARLMGYLTVRSGIAFVLSILIASIIGRKIIDRLQLMQVGEIVRNLGLEGQEAKKGTPTMGGVIIIIAIIIPCLLVGRLDNIYMILMLISTLLLGALGFMDDYLKISKGNKDGLSGKFKIIGQVGVGLLVGLTMYLSPDIVMRESVGVDRTAVTAVEISAQQNDDIKTAQTTIPFVKNNNFNYQWLTEWMGDYAETGGWILFILVAIFIVTAISNGANLTDGLDGLAAGSSAIIGVALLIMCYLGGNVIYSGYLNIMYIPNSGELVVYAAAFVGALIGFLWYNSYPAQVFMGDTGSLMLGGVIAVFAILIRKELIIPILCGVFIVENLSVVMQVIYFKKTKGRRIFKSSPLHHHFQIEGDGRIDAIIQRPLAVIPEAKIVARFLIVGILLAVITFVTLKLR
ncbi:MAG: phospho-N-acetylmuramoyl-pentapeptide-transferase [Bacteroidales bacterium]